MYVATAKPGIRMERDDVVIMLAHPGIAVCLPRKRRTLLRQRWQDLHVILVTRPCDITGRRRVVRVLVRLLPEFGNGGGGNARSIADRVTERHPSCSQRGVWISVPPPDSKITTGHHGPQSEPPARPWHFQDCCWPVRPSWCWP